MSVLTKAALVAGLALSIAAGPAKADVIYNFTQVGPASGPQPGASSVMISGQVVVSDQAAANGFSYAIFNNSGYPYQASLGDLIGLVVTGGNHSNVTGGNGFATLDDFFYQRPFAPQNSFRASFNLTGGAGSGLNGRMDYLNTESEFNITFSGSTFTGTFGADYGAGCGAATPCRYSGVITTAVPEPASLALFGAGLLGLAAVRRKRSA